MKRNIHIKHQQPNDFVGGCELFRCRSLGSVIANAKEQGIMPDSIDTPCFDDDGVDFVDPLGDPRSDHWDRLEQASNDYVKQMQSATKDAQASVSKNNSNSAVTE